MDNRGTYNYAVMVTDDITKARLNYGEESPQEGTKAVGEAISQITSEVLGAIGDVFIGDVPLIIAALEGIAGSFENQLKTVSPQLGIEALNAVRKRTGFSTKVIQFCPEGKDDEQ